MYLHNSNWQFYQYQAYFCVGTPSVKYW